MSGYLLILAIICLGGAIATIGDRLGFACGESQAESVQDATQANGCGRHHFDGQHHFIPHPGHSVSHQS
ncbi:MAG: DUF3084 domain-containing protein [Acaryochloridaceae cyanobacterium RL_2_7]|nr:DUF3084 domain-containing protein [Acaryochloridaceae cyanobacterium RL_2_7]